MEDSKYTEATRSKRMFGMLNSTLQQFKKENVQVGGKRKELEQKLFEKHLKERKETDERKAEMEKQRDIERFVLFSLFTLRVHTNFRSKRDEELKLKTELELKELEQQKLKVSTTFWLIFMLLNHSRLKFINNRQYIFSKNIFWDSSQLVHSLRYSLYLKFITPLLEKCSILNSL
jgi:hypothetical protein